MGGYREVRDKPHRRLDNQQRVRVPEIRESPLDADAKLGMQDVGVDLAGRIDRQIAEPEDSLQRLSQSAHSLWLQRKCLAEDIRDPDVTRSTLVSPFVDERLGQVDSRLHHGVKSVDRNRGSRYRLHGCLEL